MSTFIEPKYIFNDGVMEINPKYIAHHHIVEIHHGIRSMPPKSDLLKDLSQHSSLLFFTHRI